VEEISDDIAPVSGVTPWLKWCGGKRALAPKLVAEVTAIKPKLYIEPFLGGGAVALALPSELRKILSDVNQPLIDCWLCMQKIPGTLFAELDNVERAYGNEKEGYLQARAEFNRMVTNPRRMWAKRSALFIYLNARCFNGLWRTNSNGHFNVPCGERLAPRVYTADEFAHWHGAIKSCDLRSDDFSKLLGGEFTDRANAICSRVTGRHQQHDMMTRMLRGVAVYADPPYDGTFDGYAKDGFGEQDQCVLAVLLASYAEAGAGVWATNSDTDLIREAYQWAQLEEINESHVVGSKAERRGKRGCLLIRGGAAIQ
jgi:DNA adenine methylase